MAVRRPVRLEKSSARDVCQTQSAVSHTLPLAICHMAFNFSCCILFKVLGHSSVTATDIRLGNIWNTPYSDQNTLCSNCWRWRGYNWLFHTSRNPLFPLKCSKTQFYLGVSKPQSSVTMWYDWNQTKICYLINSYNYLNCFEKTHNFASKTTK